MINHVSIGVRSIARARTFYDAVLSPLGYLCLSVGDTSLGYGSDSVVFWLGQTDEPVAANPQSGLHFCINAPTRQSVDIFHIAALAAGGQDNGKPSLRPDYGSGYYAAFVIDPDGYRIEAYCNQAS